MSTFKDPLSPEFDDDLVIDPSIDTELDKINSLDTPEAIEAYKKDLEKVMPKSVQEIAENSGKTENLTDTSVNAPTDTKTDGNENNQPESTNAPQETPADAGQVLDKPKLVLDDELFSRIPESDRKMFESFKGKPIDEIFKSYANAQRLVGKRKEDLLADLQTTIVGQTQPVTLPKEEPKPAEQQQQIPESKQVQAPNQDAYLKSKEEYIQNQLRLKYPDMPDNPDELKAYKANLNYEDPDAYFELKQQENQIRQFVEDDFRKIEYYRNNSTEVNQNILSNEIATIDNYVSEKLGVKLKDIGMDISLDANGDNPILRDVLYENGKFDSSLLTNFFGTSLIKQQAVVTKFLEKNLPKIIDHIAQKSRQEGFEVAKGKVPPKTLGMSPVQGQQVSREVQTVEDIESLNSMDDVQAVLAKLDAKIK